MKPERLYVLYRILIRAGMMLSATTYVPSLRQMGLTLAEVDLLNACFQVAIFFLELPTGLFADRRGRRFSILCGLASATLGEGLYAFAHGFWSALACELCIGAAFAFFSGAEEAWLKSAMVRAYGPREAMRAFQRVDAEADIASRVAVAAAGFLGSVLAQRVGAQRVWLAVAAVHALTFVFVLRSFGCHGETEEASRVASGSYARLLRGLRDLRTRPELRRALAPSLLVKLVQPIFYAWSVFFLERLHGSIGPVWLAMYPTLMLGGWLARTAWAGKRVEASRRFIILPLGLMAAGVQFMQLPGYAAPLVLFLLFELGFGFFGPVERTVFFREAPGGDAATYGSLRGFAGSLVAATVLLVSWLRFRGEPASIVQLQQKMAACGWALALGLVAWGWWIRPGRAASSP